MRPEKPITLPLFLHHQSNLLAFQYGRSLSAKIERKINKTGREETKPTKAKKPTEWWAFLNMAER